MSDSRVLRILVVGGRLGESIVIQTPGGHTGVVDCYASSPGDPRTNPTIELLTELGVARLRFIALTHPHEDHFRGLPTLFERFSGSVQEYWKPPFSSKDHQAFVKTNSKQAIHETDLDEQGRIMLRNEAFVSLLERVQYEKNTFGMRLQDQYEIRSLLEEENEFSIMCLGPSSNTLYDYQKSMSACIEGGTLNSRFNELSSVLAVRYGDWIGLLGGDCERKSWNDLLSTKARKIIEKARFIKVSHHGSDTGSFTDLWAALETRCNAVVTCFASQGLPNSAGVDPIVRAGNPLHSTSAALAGELIKTGSTPRPLQRDTKNDRRLGTVRVAVDVNGATSIETTGEGGIVSVHS